MSFCGSSCDVETSCPEGTECQLVKTTEGADSYQCVAESGMCECSNTAIDAAMATPCSLENDEGTCTGVRICQEAGYECSATEASEEICNGVDDNCDGTIDVGTCDDGNGCTIDTCAGEAGCQYEPLNEGECLDGDACTIGDHCEDGVCVGTPIDCEDGNPCTRIHATG